MQKGQVWLSCLLGGVIGGAIFFAFHLQYGWTLWLALPIGALIGGLIAYLWYDLAGVKDAISKAYQDVIDWKPDCVWWKKFAGLFFSQLAVFLFTFFVLELLILTMPMITLGTGYLTKNVYLVLLGANCALVVMTAWASFATAIGSVNSEKADKIIENNMEAVLKVLNPIAILFWVLVGIGYTIVYSIKGTCWLVCGVPKGVVTTVKFFGLCWLFTKTMFCYIHTQGRLIVMIDTALGVLFGVALGLHYNNPLLGTFACGFIGMILGEINYRIVSIRWLKVQPT